MFSPTTDVIALGSVQSSMAGEAKNKKEPKNKNQTSRKHKNTSNLQKNPKKRARKFISSCPFHVDVTH